MCIITIGHSNKNDIVLSHKSISKYHLEATYHYKNHSCTILDLDSTNGTIVNNRKINKAKIDSKDQLILGKSSINSKDLLEKIRRKYYNKKSDFSEEYNDIINDLDIYSIKKLKLQKSPMLPIFLRIGLSIFMVVILLFFSDLIPNPNLRYVLIVVIGLVPTTMGLFSNNNNKEKKEQLDLLLLDYEDYLKCPKCQIPLLKFSSLYLKKKKKCPNPKCNVTFNNLDKHAVHT